MVSDTRPIVIAGNWKMNKTRSEARMLAKQVLDGSGDFDNHLQVVLFPPFTAIADVAQVVTGSPVGVGAQNMDHRASGAVTGEISAPMLVDAGATWILIGHSERRQYFSETNASVNLKLKAALSHQLRPVVCVGETGDERESGLADAVVRRQVASSLEAIPQAELNALVIAYEPVWAIGTGSVCDAAEADRVGKLIRSTIANLPGLEDLASRVPVLYGGSVNPGNTEAIFKTAHLDGVLVGGASLNPDEFLAIVKIGTKVQALSAP